MVQIPDQKKLTKPWGYEVIVEHTEKYALKSIFIKKGTRTSLQSHNQKLETVLVLSGSLELEIIDEEGCSHRNVFIQQQSYTIPPKTIHRVTAIEDLYLIEVSTPELDDITRHQDDFGRNQ